MDAPLFGVGDVADTVLIQPWMLVTVVVPAGTNPTFPQTSQSPAARESDVTFAGVAVVSETGVPTRTADPKYSPTSTRSQAPGAAAVGTMTAQATLGSCSCNCNLV